MIEYKIINQLINCLSTGVPQGSILGPLIFALYINYLYFVCPGINIQMYEDDTVIYLHGNSLTQVSNDLGSV